MLTSSLLVNTSGKCWPQGLCTCYSFCLEWFHPDHCMTHSFIKCRLRITFSETFSLGTSSPNPPYTHKSLSMLLPLVFFRKDLLRRWPLSRGLDEVRIGTMKTSRKWAVHLEENAKGLRWERANREASVPGYNRSGGGIDCNMAGGEGDERGWEVVKDVLVFVKTHWTVYLKWELLMVCKL